MNDPIHVRVFLSSPGDVAFERSAARRILGELSRDPLLRGRVTVEAVSWDDPDAPTPMPANVPPQHAIDRALPKPSECDLTTLILWRRMGTPTRSTNGKDLYASGTAAEAADALRARKPLLIYHRKDLSAKADATEEELAQLASVGEFLGGFRSPDGSLKGFINEYESPDDFERLFAAHMKAELRQVIERDRKRTRRRALLALGFGLVLCAIMAFAVDVAVGALGAAALLIVFGAATLFSSRSRLGPKALGVAAVVLVAAATAWCTLVWSVATRSQRQLDDLVDTASTRSESGRVADALDAYTQCVDLAHRLARDRTRMECLCGKGAQEWLLDRSDASTKDFKGCLTVALDLKDAAGEGRARLGLGRLVADQSDVAGALPLFEEAALAYGRASQPVGVADVRRAMAAFYQKRGDLVAARVALTDARVGYESAKNARGAAQTDLAFGDLELEAGNPEAAKKHYGAALDAARGANDRLDQANALLQLGELARQTSDANSAREYYTKAEDLFTHEQDSLGLANVVRGLADLDAALGHPDVARAEYQRAIGSFRAANNAEGEANALLGIGTIERDARNFTLAAQSFQAARGLFDKANDRAGASNTLIEQGELAVMQDDEVSAKRLFEEALRTAHDTRNAFAEGNALLALGRLFTDTNGPLAGRYLTDASSAFDKAHDEPGRGNAAFLRGKIAANADDVKEAERQFTIAYDVFLRSDDVRGQGNVLLERAVLAANQGHFDESEAFFKEARAAYQRADEPAAEINVDLFEAEALVHQGRRVAAAAVLEQAVESFESRARPELAEEASKKARELKLALKR